MKKNIYIYIYERRVLVIKRQEAKIVNKMFLFVAF